MVLQLVVCLVLFSYTMQSKALLLCAVSTAQISPSSKIRTPIHHGSTKSLRSGETLSLPLIMGIAMCFFLWEHFLKVFGSKSDVLLPVGTSKITLV